MPATGVRLGDVYLPAYDDQPADAYGVVWALTGLDGWDDGWEGASSVEQKTWADGAWTSPMYAGPRVIHIQGWLEAASWDAVTLAWNRLLSQLPFRSLGTLQVSTGEGTVPEMVTAIQQHEKPILNERFDNRGEFSLSVIAPDPRRYSLTTSSVNLVLPLLSGGIAPPLTPPITVTGSTTVSQATLYNAGTTVSYPVLTITGPCPPATIANLTTSEAVRVVDPVLAGETLVIDLLNGTAVTGGQARRVLGTWWGLLPGNNEIAFNANGYDAAAALNISYRSAWK